MESGPYAIFCSNPPLPSSTFIAMDKLLIAADNALRTLFARPRAAQPSPARGLPEGDLSPAQRREAGALMRVNHVGEVCAQALYMGQAAVTRDPSAARARLMEAAREETDHLAWTAERLQALGSRPSLLNPLWFAGAFAIGWTAAQVSDAASLGFVVETENQVARHLQGAPGADAAAGCGLPRGDRAHAGRRATACRRRPRRGRIGPARAGPRAHGRRRPGDDGYGTPYIGSRVQASTMSKPVVISAVLPSMMLAEQYFSWLMAMARSTAAGGRAPARDGEVHVDAGEHFRVGLCTLGTELHAAAADVVAAPSQDEHHVVGGAAAGAGEDRFHRPGARFCPPLAGLAASGAPSMARTWPLPVSAMNPMPERVPEAPVQVTVHSMLFFPIKLAARRLSRPHHRDFAASQHRLRYTCAMRCPKGLADLKRPTRRAHCLLHLLKGWIRLRISRSGAVFAPARLGRAGWGKGL